MAYRVCVIMSLYQPDLGYLAQQLESIAAQDREPGLLEVLIRNDYPTGDDLSDFCHEHCPDVPLRYVHGDKNLGYAQSFEWLVTHAAPTCDAIALCDQDDIWRPDRIKKGVAPLEAGALASACDRFIIDGEGATIVKSWRAGHPSDPECQWHTGDRFVSESIFSAMAPGMAMMVDARMAADAVPFSPATGHDKWLMTCANIQGDCAFVDEPLVGYRRHGDNVSGVLVNVESKQDWYASRVDDQLAFAIDARRRFPDCAELDDAIAFARARKCRDLAGIWRYRYLAPKLAQFEIILAVTPDPIFRMALSFLKR